VANIVQGCNLMNGSLAEQHVSIELPLSYGSACFGHTHAALMAKPGGRKAQKKPIACSLRKCAKSEPCR
jgi:hypothetical protein